VSSLSEDDAAILEAVDQLLVPGEGRYTKGEVARAAHIDPEHLTRFWRAMGFPDVAHDEAVFTDTDVALLSEFGRLLRDDMVDPEVAFQMTRVVGQAMSRVADAEVAAIRERLEVLEAGDGHDEEMAERIVQRSAKLLPTMEALLLYQWRRHLAAAARRTVMARRTEGDAGLVTTVGFADMVGFTMLSQQLDERELAEVVDRFEVLAYDTVAERGGRIIKMIGDEAMFVTEEPASAVDIGLTLVDVYSDDETVSDVRVGIAHGPVLGREGDYFGPTVNLASRIVNIAYVGSVVVSTSVQELLADDERFWLRPVRPRRLKGIGITPLWVVRRPGEAPGLRLPTGVVERMFERRRP
jgi:adenylate cyclase